MNKDKVKGKAKQVKGDLKEKYGRATDQPSKRVEGEAEKAEGNIQETYGEAKD